MSSSFLVFSVDINKYAITIAELESILEFPNSFLNNTYQNEIIYEKLRRIPIFNSHAILRFKNPEMTITPHSRILMIKKGKKLNQIGIGVDSINSIVKGIHKEGIKQRDTDELSSNSISYNSKNIPVFKPQNYIQEYRVPKKSEINFFKRKYKKDYSRAYYTGYKS
ncbi:MAG: hypothetical protein EAX86_02780 [Candidatus Heimdallarchaeota archaeon]|nr:hypothetical protein [Candidatus Heimdallarchaeota archaeon]